MKIPQSSRLKVDVDKLIGDVQRGLSEGHIVNDDIELLFLVISEQRRLLGLFATAHAETIEAEVAS